MGWVPLPVRGEKRMRGPSSLARLRRDLGERRWPSGGARKPRPTDGSEGLVLQAADAIAEVS